MKERAHLFGESGGLLGILSEPGATSNRPTVILLNAGLVHRVGPFRMSVELARSLAAAGFPALRMDLSGLGDSAPRPGESDPGARVLADVRDAMDFLGRRYGARQFIVAGLCLGAINAHRAAVSDARVVGAVLLDGYAYPTLRFLLRRYGPRLASPAAVVRFAWRQLGSLNNLVTDQPAVTRPEEETILDQDFPPQRQIAAELRQLMERNVQLLFVYSGNWSPYFNYREQVRDNFPGVAFAGRLTVEHLPEADHTYTLLEDRQRLFERVLTWTRERFA
jgi:pimeloyl-ACP methyl ester carboxylesterase